MKFYITPGAPYAHMVRIVVLDKGLEDRVEITIAKTRAAAVTSAPPNRALPGTREALRALERERCLP